MKKMVSLLLSATMIFSTIGIAAAAKETDTAVKIIFSENFDSTQSGGTPTSVSVMPKGNSLKVENVPDETNRSLCNSILSSDDSYAEKSFSEVLTGKFVMEASVRIDNHANSKKLVYFARSSASKNKNLLEINQSGMMVAADGTNVAQILEGKFYHIAIAVDTEKGTYDVFVNNRKRARNISMGELTDIAMIRMHIYSVTAPCSTKMYVDDMMVYKGDRIMTAEEKQAIAENVSIDSSTVITPELKKNRMKNAVALYAGAPRAMVRGTVKYIDSENPETTPYIENGTTFVPVRFISEALGGKVTWDEAAQTVSVKLNGKTIKLTVGNNVIDVDGEAKTISAAPMHKDNRVFLPLRAMGELAGKKVFWDETGIIVLSDEEEFFHWDTDINLMRSVVGDLIYDRPTGAEVLERLKEKNPNNAHPRVMANQTTFDTIKRKLAEGDDLTVRWFNSTKTTADVYMKQAITTYNIPDGIRLLEASRSVLRVVGNCSFIYKITGDESYALRAWKEMQEACSWKDWNPTHTLDTGELLCAMAIGYDWLYDYLDDDQKATIREAVCKNGFNAIMDDYLDNPRTRTYYWSTAAQQNNWNTVCNGGTLMAAIAIGDEEEEISTQIFEYGLRSLENSLNLWAPDGAWFEGLTYWSYTVTYLTKCLSTLEAALGTDYGCFNAPGLARAGYYLYSVTGPKGVFNFHDASEGFIDSSEIFWFAEQLGNKDLTALRLNDMEERNVGGSYTDLLWYNTEPDTRKVNMDLDWYFRDTEVMTMRSSWDNASALFAGIQAGKSSIPHSHLDCGTFVLDSNGTRFAIDLGSDDYNLKGGTYNRYRYRAEGHNTLVINPSSDYDQSLTGAAVIDRHESNRVSSYAITDMSNPYEGKADSVVRGLKLCDNRSTVVVQDEVKNETPVDVWWFMHTRCEIEISEDGRSAILSENNNRMVVKILSDTEGQFTVMDASPMPNSPVIEGQNPNAGIQKLALNVKDVTDMRLAIGFKGFYSDEEVPDEFPEVTPLDSWTLEDDSNIGETELPKLRDLKVNGETLSFFDAEKTLYEFNENPGERYVPEISAEGDGEVEIIYPKQIPGNVRIVLNKNGVKNTYIVKVKISPLQGELQGVKEIPIVAADASGVPQPENGIANSYDNDFDTRWSCDGSCWIEYDLGSVQKVDYVGLAFWKGQARIATFDIRVSEDGENWTKVLSTESSGTTDEIEKYNIEGANARYVRVYGYGTTEGSWFSLLEFKAYTEANS